MKRLPLLLLVLVAGTFQATAAGPAEWSAKAEANPELRSYGFPGHIIAIKFPKPMPVATVRQLANYSLFRSDAPDKPIELHRVKSGANLHGGDPKVEASQALVLPREDLPPPGNSRYLVQVQFGNESSGEIEVIWPEDETAPAPPPEPSDNALINLISISTNFLFGPLSAKVDVRSAFEDSHAPAFDFELKYDLPGGPLFLKPDQTNFSRLWMGGMNLAAEGTYKIDGDDTNIADHLSLSLNLDLLYLYRLGNPLTQRNARGEREGRLVYYAGFRLKGFEFEADQDFEVSNWSVEPQLALWLPYSNLPGLWWSRQMGIRRNAATPLFVYLGYSFVDSIATDPSEVASELQTADRVELELAYAFPLTSRLRLGLRSRHFWLEGGNGQPSYQELFARYYLTDAKTSAVLLKYTRGALPPKFEKGDAVGAGFAFEF